MERYPEPVAGTYIFDSKDRILLMRGPKWGKLWIVPGGHIEYGESVFDAAAREAMEEMGVKVKPVGVYRVFEDIYPKDFHDKKKHFIYIEVICKALSGRVKLDDREAKEYLWMRESEVRTKHIHESVRKLILDYLREKKSGKVNFIDVKI